jgi:long-chain acyl-CoA synthetase
VFGVGYGQTLELHALMAHGAALGIAEGVDKLLGNLQEIRPTLLFSVPVLFKRIYDGIHTKVRNSRYSGLYVQCTL